jgi:AcrR family transcriptional regulator
MDEATTQKKDIILNAAIKVFAEKGYYSSRTLDISNEAGVAYGSLYHYFRSKDDILISIFQERWNLLIGKVQQAREQGAGPEEQLGMVIDFIFRSYRQNPDLLKVLIMDVPRLDKFYNPENWKLYNLFFRGLMEIFHEGQEKGVFAADVSPIMATYIMHGAVDATIRQYVYNPEFNKEEFPVEEARDQIMKVLRRGFSKKGEDERS